MTRRRALAHLAPAGLILSSLSLPAGAGSFYLPASDSVAALGRGYAGQAALGYDATSVMSNPAALTRLSGSTHWSVGLNALKTDVRIRDQGTTVLDNAVPGGIPVGGVVEGDASDLAGLPNLAYARRIGGERNVWVGFGVQAPFGLGIEYSPAFRGRYDTREARLRVIDVSGAVGFQLTDSLSIGGGVNVQRTDARLENAVPNLNGTGVPGQFASDGVLIVRADSYAVGGNVGLHLKASDSLQLGLHYKSRMSHDLEGYAIGQNLTGVPGVLPLDLLNGRSTSATRLNLPDVVTASAAWQATDKLSLMAELRWFNWSRFRELAFRFDSPGDFLYYVLLAYEQCRLKPDAVPLFLSGNILENGAIYRNLVRYVQSIHFLNWTGTVLPDTAVSLPNKHFFFDLFAAASETSLVKY